MKPTARLLRWSKRITHEVRTESCVFIGYLTIETNICLLTFSLMMQIDVRYPSHVSTEAKDLISRLLRKDPGARLGLEEVLSHTWITLHGFGTPPVGQNPQQ